MQFAESLSADNYRLAAGSASVQSTHALCYSTVDAFSVSGNSVNKVFSDDDVIASSDQCLQ